MIDKENKYFRAVITAFAVAFIAYLFISVGNYLIHKKDVVVVYEAGEISEGFNEMQEQKIEEVEIVMIDETEFEDIDCEETFEGNPNIPLSVELQKFIAETCTKYSVNEAVVLAIMESESTFRTDVGTEKVLGGQEGGARYYGYMQLSAANCNRAKKEFGLDAHTPEGNIEMGIILLANYIEKYGELDSVITAYKAGESVADAGKKLKVCDSITDRVMYWQEILTE